MENYLFAGLLLLVIIYYVLVGVSPKLDWNYETGEKLLWFSDPFDSWKRKAVTLWKKKD